MDPLTHALAGATLAAAASRHRIGRRALLIGAAAALLPDTDVFIRSSTDPLLVIEHHRGFTHSLLFAPVGGTAAALLLRRRDATGDRKAAMVAGILAYLSHAVLDAATTYGTQLFWPFSRARVGLDVISIIDPLFTLLLLIGFVAAWRNARRLVNGVLACALVWLAIGYVQRERATVAQLHLAASRGEVISRAAVFPTIGNTIVWRSLYETGGLLRMDRIRVPWFGGASAAAGDRVPLATYDPRTSRRDFERLSWFADGWIAGDPRDVTMIGDARYSLHPHQYEPVWGIRSSPAGTEWVDRSRQRRVSSSSIIGEISGRDERYEPVR